MQFLEMIQDDQNQVIQLKQNLLTDTNTWPFNKL